VERVVSQLKVVPIAWTVVDAYAIDRDTPYNVGNYTSSEELAEFAGRNCYQSWDRPNPKTADNKDYINNILKQQHFSVLEHGSVTFLVSGVSRSLLAEWTRHRHFSFSVLSQRYVDQNEVGVVVPPVFEDFPELKSLLYRHDGLSYERYKTAYDTLTEAGIDHKAARGAARAFLPETFIVATGNHRTWREFIQKRNSPGADIEIRILAQRLLQHLKLKAPNIYQDMEIG
jgi:thymidylate synthase (FAD)